MGGVEGDEGELAGLDAIDDAVGGFPGDFALALVAPPDEDVGFVEGVVGECGVVVGLR